MISINLHFVQSIEAKAVDGEKASWVDMKVKSENETAEITMFFANAAMAAAYAAAINSVKTPPVAQQEAA